MCSWAFRQTLFENMTYNYVFKVLMGLLCAFGDYIDGYAGPRTENRRHFKEMYLFIQCTGLPTCQATPYAVHDFLFWEKSKALRIGSVWLQSKGLITAIVAKTGRPNQWGQTAALGLERAFELEGFRCDSGMDQTEIRIQPFP